MTYIKDENYYVIQGWMINKLKLKGNDLLIFALIYGFTQDGKNEFTGSLNYLCEFTQSTKKTVLNSLSNLIKLGYVTKKQETLPNNTKCNKYKANLWMVDVMKTATNDEEKGSVKITPPMKMTANDEEKGSVKITPPVENTTQGSVKITPNNYIYKYNDINDRSNVIYELFNQYGVELKFDQDLILKYVEQHMSIEVIREAFEIAFTRGYIKYPIPYALTIVKKWNDMHIKTLDDLKLQINSQCSADQSKEFPDWYLDTETKPVDKETLERALEIQKKLGKDKEFPDWYLDTETKPVDEKTRQQTLEMLNQLKKKEIKQNKIGRRIEEAKETDLPF